MTTAIGLFVIAAALGVYAGYKHLSDQLVSVSTALIHGAFAAAGLIALILVATASQVSSLATWALGLFVVAALGGFILFAMHLRGQPLPRGLIYVHGLAAVTAFVLLLAGSGLF